MNYDFSKIFKITTMKNNPVNLVIQENQDSDN